MQVADVFTAEVMGAIKAGIGDATARKAQDGAMSANSRSAMQADILANEVHNTQVRTEAEAKLNDICHYLRKGLELLQRQYAANLALAVNPVFKTQDKGGLHVTQKGQTVLQFRLSPLLYIRVDEAGKVEARDEISGCAAFFAPALDDVTRRKENSIAIIRQATDFLASKSIIKAEPA